MASLLDLLPTILQLVGVEPVKGVILDGYDMGPILFDKKPVRAVNDAIWSLFTTLTSYLRVDYTCTECRNEHAVYSLN